MAQSLKAHHDPIDELHSSLGPATIFVATRMEALAGKYVYEPFGLTAAGAKILKTLMARGDMSPTQLARLVGGTKSNLSQRISVLEKRSLVERHASTSNDAREKTICITDAGRMLITNMSASSERARAYFDNKFSAAERKRFLHTIARMHEVLDEADADTNLIPSLFSS